jgi:nucleotide-binding universal stress UspA family protein
MNEILPRNVSTCAIGALRRASFCRRVGKAYEQIVKLAEETQSDLLVVGVHGRGALDAAVFGSTTYRVTQLGTCPVLVLRA